MAIGFSNAYEAAILDGIFYVPKTATPRSLYLYLFKVTTTWGPNSVMADDGTLGSELDLLTAAGGGPKTLADSDFAAASGGNPTTRALQTEQKWTAGATFGDLCWWAVSTVSGSTITTEQLWTDNKASMVAHGPITDGAGVPVKIAVANGESFQFDATNPILFQIGDTGFTINGSAVAADTFG